METGVYGIYCTVNGKWYIGSTRRGFVVRLEEHLARLLEGTHWRKQLQEDWNELGPSAFQVRVLFRCPIEECQIKEYRVTALLRTDEDEFGYNSSKRRWHADNRDLGRRIAIENTRRMNEVNRERGPMPEGHREKVRQNMLRNRLLRPPDSEETKQKKSDATRGVPKSRETRARMVEGWKRRKENGFVLTDLQKLVIRVNAYRRLFKRYGKEYASFEEYFVHKAPRELVLAYVEALKAQSGMDADAGKEVTICTQ